MRLPQRKSNVREAAFKTENNKEEKEDICSFSDEEEAEFVKKLDRGSGKYKGKLPFKCFNYGRVGHYAAKCPHKKTRNQAQESEKTISKNWQKGKKFNRNLSMLNKIAVHLKTQMNPQVKKQPPNLY